MSNLITTYTKNGKQFRVVGDTSDSIKNVLKPVVNGDLFIVPNLAMSKSNYFSQERFDSWVEEHVEEVQDTLDLRTHDLSEDRFVQVWVTSPKSENWADHGMGLGYGHFPSYLPAKWLEGLSEGDVLVIAGTRNRFWLTLSQKSYRYNFAGTFEEVLAKVNKDYVSKSA